MRLIEEKKLVKGELLILVFVVLTGVGIQFCSLEIATHKSKLLSKISELSLTESVRISHKVSSFRYQLSAFTDANLGVDSAQVESLRLLDPQLAEILNEYTAGRISKNEYFNRLSIRHYSKSHELQEISFKLLKEKNHLLQNPPVWSSLQYILSTVQFVAILGAIFVYFLIYRSISNRAG